MKSDFVEKNISLLIKRYPFLDGVRKDIEDVYYIIQKCYENGGKLLIAGNGGSAADAQHIVGELMKGFKYRRPVGNELRNSLLRYKDGEQLANTLQCGLPAIALTDHQALSTAFVNDADPYMVYAQQVCGYGNTNDVFLGISTSGNAKNVMLAAITAKAKGMKVIGLTGKDGGGLARFADKAVIVPENETYMIQEAHLPIYHCWCLMLEQRFFSE